MDERHWWFATKLQETFNVGIFDDPTVLEDFISNPNTVEQINNFLQANGNKVIFFYSHKPKPDGEKVRSIYVTEYASNLPTILAEDGICIYFMRSSNQTEVDVVGFEQEIFCGQVNQDVLGLYTTLISDVFTPLLKKQKDWGDADEEEVHHFIYSLEKYASTLSEYSQANVGPQQILKRPSSNITTDFKHNRAAAVNATAILEYENLVIDWIQSIENVLMEGLEERYSLLHNY